MHRLKPRPSHRSKYTPTMSNNSGVINETGLVRRRRQTRASMDVRLGVFHQRFWGSLRVKQYSRPPLWGLHGWNHTLSLRRAVHARQGPATASHRRRSAGTRSGPKDRLVQEEARAIRTVASFVSLSAGNAEVGPGRRFTSEVPAIRAGCHTALRLPAGTTSVVATDVRAIPSVVTSYVHRLGTARVVAYLAIIASVLSNRSREPSSFNDFLIALSTKRKGKSSGRHNAR